MAAEYCENCGKKIGVGEVAGVLADHVVCTGCREKLTASVSPPPDSRVPEAVAGFFNGFADEMAKPKARKRFTSDNSRQFAVGFYVAMGALTASVVFTILVLILLAMGGAAIIVSLLHSAH